MRSSRLFAVLLLLLGLTLLWRGLQWYDDYLARISAGPRVASVPGPPQPSATPTPVPTAEPVPPPTAEEIEALAAPGEAAQWAAVDVLLKRQVTAELAAAVAAVGPANSAIAQRLDCLRARAPGEPAIDLAVEQLAAFDAVWPSNVDHALCLVEVLAARAVEQPDRIRDALIPYAMSYPGRLRSAALEGLTKLPLGEMSPKLQEASAQAVSASFPVGAALALGLDEDTAPELVEEWLQSPEPSASSVIRRHLVGSPKRSAAVFIALRLVLDPGNPELLGLARARGEKAGDVSDALADIALDEARALHERQAALELIGTTGQPATLARIEPLVAASDTALRSYAEAAVAALRARR